MGWKLDCPFEAKAATPPATEWLRGQPRGNRQTVRDISDRSVRCADPFYRPAADWITRRLRAALLAELIWRK